MTQLNRESYARAICAKENFQTSTDNIDVLVAIMAGENSQANNNPLDTEEGGQTGETNYNSAGVKDYPTLDEGIQAVHDTLHNGYYDAIIASFARSNPAATTAELWDLSPWGTKNVAQMLTEVQNDRTSFYTMAVYPLDTSAPVTNPVVTTPVVNPTPVVTTAPTTNPVGPFNPAWPTISIADEQQSTPAVKAIQAALRYVWGYEIAIDGSYGPVTAGAVTSFQRSRQITQDGITGPETFPLLYGI